MRLPRFFRRRRDNDPLNPTQRLLCWATEWRPPPSLMGCVVAIELRPGFVPDCATVAMLACCMSARVRLDPGRLPDRASVLAELDREAARLIEANERRHAEHDMRAMVVARDDAPPLDIGPIVITSPVARRPVDCGGEGKGGDDDR